MSKEEKEEAIIEVLKKDPRASLVTIAKRTKMAVSTVFDTWERIKHKYGFVMYDRVEEKIVIVSTGVRRP